VVTFPPSEVHGTTFPYNYECTLHGEQSRMCVNDFPKVAA